MDNWEDLLNTAIIGTQNNPPPQGSDANDSAEQSLLKQLALASIMRRAGSISAQGKPPTETDTPLPETLPKCSLVAMGWLRRTAESTVTRVLAMEWFLLIASRQKRIPHTDLHYVLNLSNKTADYAPYIVPVMGERGKWLVSRSDTYPHLKQQELWTGEAAALQVPAIDPANTYLINQREQMLKDLAYE
jgi:hypothetical protein